MTHKWTMVIGSHRSGTNLLCMSLQNINNLWYTSEALQVFRAEDIKGRFVHQWRKPMLQELFGKEEFSYYMKHPEHRAYGMIPGKEPALKLLQKMVLEDRCGEAPKSNTCVTKVLFQQHPCSFNTWFDIVKLPVNIIYLRRHNLLDIIISAQLAYRSQEWLVMAKKEITNGKMRINLNPIYVLEELCFLQHQYDYFDRWTQDLSNVLTLDYDELANDWDSQAAIVTDFMGCSGQMMTKRTKRQISRTQEEVVDNYAQLREYFSNTKWKDLFKC